LQVIGKFTNCNFHWLVNKSSPCHSSVADNSYRGHVGCLLQQRSVRLTDGLWTV